jgi:haloacetate dehalogenase
MRAAVRHAPAPDLFPGFRVERHAHQGVHIHARVGGSGPPVLLLHGFPQTHVMWHKVAPRLAAHYTLVLPDLRGYGDSEKPATTLDHAPYSKRAMAADMSALMRTLGHERFFLCGHDRGGRVAHRLALDTPESVAALMVLDISPTRTMYERTTMDFARDYYHWFFLIQPAPLPERLIGGDPLFYLRSKTGGWGSDGHSHFDPRAYAEYERCFTPDAVHAMCEDYRAASSIDLVHDRADSERRIACPVRVLWGELGVVNRHFTPIADWQDKAALPVSGRAMPSGHYIAEQLPELLSTEIQEFFAPSLLAAHRSTHR